MPAVGDTSSGLRSRPKTTAADDMDGPASPLPAPSTSSPSSSHHHPSITDLTISLPSSSSASSIETKASRWRTGEFRLYALVFALVVPVMIWCPVQLSSPHHPNYVRYAGRLSPGWILGRQVDNSDPQYRTFRSGLPSLLLLSSIHLLFSRLQHWLARSPPARAKDTAFFSVLILLVLHGFSALKVLAILRLNFHLSTSPKTGLWTKAWPVVLVVGNMGILFANDRWDGYHLGHLHAIFDPIDALGGVLPRWHISFNITVLRLISFGLDYHWRSTGAPSFDPAASVEPSTGYRTRVKTPLAEDEYNWHNFLAYCLYPPLYIAGPIMTFNDFVWQLKHPLAITYREKLAYLGRFLASLLAMEITLHSMYVVAIKDTAAWEGDSPAELSMIGFWNLIVVWLKLLIPWRFFRLWALLDGVDPPENMIRCVANNYSTLGFWRSWHRSYNLWIVRYIYVPLGGARNVVMSTLLVFTFVALWHDLSFKLLAWGWLVSLFILPEILAKQLLPAAKFGSAPWYRHVCALGGVLNVLMMMSANLVGFVLGLDGMKHLVGELTSTWHGIGYMVFACACLFVAVQVMFEYREEEKRRGIDRRC